MASGTTSPSLAMRTARGAGWIILWRMATRTMGLINTIVLVRLLAPADFGLVALATSFSQIVEWLSGIGVADALIREHSLNRSLYDTGFTLNLLRGILISLAIAGEAFPVAGFFNDPRLAYILLVLAVTVLLASVENIGVVDFRRTLAFEKEFQISVVPRIAGIAVSISCAILFASFWALVAGIATNRLCRVVITYWMHSYRPRLTLCAWRQIIRFSLWSWVAGIVTIIRDRIDTVVIGRVLGTTSVGVYSVGYEIGSLTSTELVEPLTTALFAGFAQGRRTGANVSSGYFKVISATFLLTLPAGVGMSLLAAPFVRLVFGAQWMNAVPLVQVFSLIAMLKVIAYFSTVLFNADGKIHLSTGILASALVVRVVMLATLIIPFGLMGAATAAVIATLIEELVFLVVTFRQFDLRPFDLLRGTWRCMIATGIMALGLTLGGVGWAQPAADTMNDVYSLVVGATSGAIVYTVTLLLAWWLAGRPEGAETMLINLLVSAARHIRRICHGRTSSAV